MYYPFGMPSFSVAWSDIPKMAALGETCSIFRVYQNNTLGGLLKKAGIVSTFPTVLPLAATPFPGQCTWCGRGVVGEWEGEGGVQHASILTGEPCLKLR